MNVGFPLSQGFIPSYQSSEIDIASRRVFGIKSINWEESCEGEIEYGNGPLPLGVTVGQYTASAEIEQLISEYMTLIAKLGTGFRARGFNIGVQFNEPGVDLITIDIKSARIMNGSVQGSGKGGTTVKYKVQVFEPIAWNGLTMVDRFLSGTSFSIGGAVNATAGGLASFGAGVAASFG